MVARNTTGTLPPDVSGEILSLVQDASVVQRLSRRAPLPGQGATITVLTGRPKAAFVSEGAAKPVGEHAGTDKVLRGHTLAIIEPFSNQFRRDRRRLYEQMVAQLPGALAEAFDQAVLYGTGAPGADFDNLSAATTSKLYTSGGTPYGKLIGAQVTAAAAGGEPNGFAFSPTGILGLAAQTDTTGRPLFVPDANSANGITSIAGLPAIRSVNVAPPAGAAAGVAATVGFVGDWARTVWGQVEAVQVSESEHATITYGGQPLNLWERNMFAVRVEVEVGFRFASVADFVRLTNETV